MKPENFTQIRNGKRYSTQTAKLLAHDNYWDGQNMERNGRNTFLYKTKKGNYFYLIQTNWTEENTNIIPINEQNAAEMYEELPVQEVEFETAFPNTPLEDA